jgi:hypothetical protein
MENKERTIKTITFTNDKECSISTKIQKVEEIVIESSIEIESSGYFALFESKFMQKELFPWVAPWLIFLTMTCWRFWKIISKEQREPNILLLLDALEKGDPKLEKFVFRYVPLVVRISCPFYFVKDKNILYEARSLIRFPIGPVNKTLVDAIRFGTANKVALLLNKLDQIAEQITETKLGEVFSFPVTTTINSYALHLAYFCGTPEMIMLIKNRYFTLQSNLGVFPILAVLGNKLHVLKYMNFGIHILNQHIIALEAIIADNKEKIMWLREQGVEFNIDKLKMIFSGGYETLIDQRPYLF